MELEQAISIYGTSKYSVLCYGAFHLDDYISASEVLKNVSKFKKDSFSYCLFDDDWPFAILLYELHTDTFANVEELIDTALDQVFSAGKCQVAACMYDGVFDGWQTFLHPDFAAEIYVVQTLEGSVERALDRSSRESEAWMKAIQKTQSFLRSGFQIS